MQLKPLSPTENNELPDWEGARIETVVMSSQVLEVWEIQKEGTHLFTSQPDCNSHF